MLKAVAVDSVRLIHSPSTRKELTDPPSMKTFHFSAFAALLLLSTSHALPVIQTEQPAGVILTSGTGSVTFPNVNMGDTYPKTITLRNTGDLDLLVSQVTLSGPAASDYSILVQSENTIPPGKASFLRLAFSPTSTGSSSEKGRSSRIHKRVMIGSRNDAATQRREDQSFPEFI